MNLNEIRAEFGRHMAASAGVGNDSPVAKVFSAVPRDRFVGAPPWRVFGAEGEGVLVNNPALLYQDVLVQIKGEAAINNGQPSLHALCFAALRVVPGEAAVHIGAGTGYYTAMLGKLVGEQGRVDAYEIESDLAVRARENLIGMPWIHVHGESGTAGPLPECEVLYVSASATDPLDVWLDALRVGGRLLFPLTPDEGYGGMLLVTRWKEGYAARFLCGAKFVGCEGGRDAAMGQRLTACFGKDRTAEVKSLERGGEADETAWCAGANWWLSRRAIG